MHSLPSGQKTAQVVRNAEENRFLASTQYGTPSSPAEQERKPSERYNKTGIFAGKEGAGLVWAGGNGI